MESQPENVWSLVLALGVVVCGLMVMLGVFSRSTRFLILFGIGWAVISPVTLFAHLQSLAIPALLVWLVALRLLFRRRR